MASTVSSEVIVASDPTMMPLAAASSADGQKFYSLPRPLNQANKLATRSRTPSPFRSMIKGLVKGKICAASGFLNCSLCVITFKRGEIWLLLLFQICDVTSLRVSSSFLDRL